MNECAPRARAVAVARATGKRIAIADFSPEFEECIGRRNPFDLRAVLCELAAEKRLVGKRRVLKIPRVLVLLVHVADAGKETSELRYHTVRQCRHETIRFLD